MICVIIFQHYIRLKQVTSGCFCQQVFCSPVVYRDRSLCEVDLLLYRARARQSHCEHRL